jgi:hypothetical protein
MKKLFTFKPELKKKIIDYGLTAFVTSFFACLIIDLILNIIILFKI